MNKQLLAVCLLMGAALSCGSSSSGKSVPNAGGAGSDEPGAGVAGADGKGDEPGPSDGVNSTYLDVASVAQMVYDAVEAEEDVAPHIEAVLEAFGVPTLAPDDEEGALARIDAGLPFVTSRVVEQMAEAYAETRLVDATGFAEGLVEQGIQLAFPFNVDGTKLDSSLLGGMLYSFTAGGESQPDVPLEDGTVLAALVRELGQERARRSSVDESSLDPVWGDGRLDPLQFTLLSFTLFAKQASGTDALSAAPPKLPTRFGLLQSNPGADFIKDQIKNQLKDKVEGELTSALQQITEVPLDKKDAAKVSVCGSLILYGHKITMKNTPDLLWHGPKKPNLTEVELTLTFEDDYYDNWARAVLGSAVTDLTGCVFPRKGPIGGKPLKWSVSSGLEGHGSYDVTPTKTDDFGQAVASWRTITDSYPEACHVFENQRDAVGATEAVVSGLLSGWSTVETIVTFLNPNTGGQGHDPLTVLYYEVSADDTCHRE